MYPGNIPGAPHNNKVRGICKPGLETQTPLYRSGETRTLDEIALDESGEAGSGALTDSGPEREGDGAGRCGGGEDERDEVDDVLGEDKGNERRRKGNGWNEDG